HFGGGLQRHGAQAPDLQLQAAVRAVDDLADNGIAQRDVRAAVETFGHGGSLHWRFPQLNWRKPCVEASLPGCDHTRGPAREPPAGHRSGTLMPASPGGGATRMTQGSRPAEARGAWPAAPVVTPEDLSRLVGGAGRFALRHRATAPFEWSLVLEGPSGSLTWALPAGVP